MGGTSIVPSDLVTTERETKGNGILELVLLTYLVSEEFSLCLDGKSFNVSRLTLLSAITVNYNIGFIICSSKKIIIFNNESYSIVYTNLNSVSQLFYKVRFRFH